MIAKNKGDFLYQLHHELHRIGIDNDEEIFADFEEHFKESQEAGMSEEETCEKLGDVKEIARNYLDIPSTRLNSIVADAVANQRVSLTKPGEKLPADLSLVEQDKADPAPEQPAIREYTPEHIAQEPETPQSAVPKIDLNKDAAREFTPEHIATEPEAPGAPREFTPNHIAPEQPAPNSGSRDTRYQYRTGSAPKQDSSEAFSSVHRCEMPQQNDIPKAGKYADKGGFKFTDIKGLKPNVNVGRLIGCMRQRFCRACSRRIRAAGQRLLPRHQQDTAVLRNGKRRRDSRMYRLRAVQGGIPLDKEHCNKPHQGCLRSVRRAAE